MSRRGNKGAGAQSPAPGGASGLYVLCCQDCLLRHDETAVRCSCGGELCGCGECENVALAAQHGRNVADRVRLVRAAGLGHTLRPDCMAREPHVPPDPDSLLWPEESRECLGHEPDPEHVQGYPQTVYCDGTCRGAS